MPLLWIALGLILGIDIRIHDTSSWTGMVRRRLPRAVQQFHPAQFFKDNATPIFRRAHWRQTALTVAAILIAEHAGLAEAITAQPVGAKQTIALLINGADRLLVGDCRPNQPVHIFYRLDLRFDNAHLISHNTAGEAIVCQLNSL